MKKLALCLSVLAIGACVDPASEELSEDVQLLRCQACDGGYSTDHWADDCAQTWDTQGEFNACMTYHCQPDENGRTWDEAYYGSCAYAQPIK